MMEKNKKIKEKKPVVRSFNTLESRYTGMTPDDTIEITDTTEALVYIGDALQRSLLDISDSIFQIAGKLDELNVLVLDHITDRYGIRSKSYFNDPKFQEENDKLKAQKKEK